MTCIPVTIACLCASGKFWCISTLSVFVLTYIYIICICLDVYLHYLYLSWCISTLSVFVLTLFQAPLSAGMLAIAVLIFEPVTAENGLLSSWSMSSVVSKSIILPLLDFQRVLRRISFGAVSYETWNPKCQSRHSPFLARNVNENPASETSRPLATSSLAAGKKAQSTRQEVNL